MSTKRIIILVLCLLAFTGISYINATKANPEQLKVREEIIRSARINEDLDGFLIASFSDMYYGSFFGKDKLDRAVSTINDFTPDVIIFGGDLIDESLSPLSKEERDDLVEGLKSLKATYGKYAVLGDEDVLSAERVTGILEEAGFEILSDETRVIGISADARLNIIGLNNSKNASPDLQVLEGIDTSACSFVVSHCPDLFDLVREYPVDYMFAGHSLNGQVYIPLINFFYRDAGCQKYYRGKTTRNNTTLDINNGLGQRKHNARLFSDPEIVLYKLSCD